LGYLGKSFWPVNLSFLYLRPNIIPAPTVFFAALTLVAVTLLVVSTLRAQSQITDFRWASAVGWFWFLVMLLPVSGLVQAGPQLMADRYTYLPGIGLTIMIVWSAATLLHRDRVAKGPIIACSVAMLVACIGLTRLQIAYWQNTETLMNHALQIDPNNYVAHQNLGLYYSKIGQIEAARKHRQRSQDLAPTLRRTAITAASGTEG
jgi:hypothetical protein